MVAQTCSSSSLLGEANGIQIVVSLGYLMNSRPVRVTLRGSFAKRDVIPLGVVRMLQYLCDLESEKNGVSPFHDVRPDLGSQRSPQGRKILSLLFTEERESTSGHPEPEAPGIARQALAGIHWGPIQ